MKAKDFYALAKQNGLSREDADSAASDFVKENGSFEDIQPAKTDTVAKVEVQPKEKNIIQDLGSADSWKDWAKNGMTPNFIRGAVEKVREIPQAGVRLWGKSSLPGHEMAADEIAQRDAERTGKNTLTGLITGQPRVPNAAEKAGAFAADMAMTLWPAAKGAQVAGKIPYLASKFPMIMKAFGMTAPGVLAHQTENYGATGEVKPGEAAAETVLGTSLPGIGGKFGPMLEKMGMGAVRRGLGVPAKMMDGANPIDLKWALANKKIPFFGGAEKIAANTGKEVAATNAARDAAIETAGVNLNFPRALQATKQAARGMEKAGELNAGTTKKMIPSARQSVENARNQAFEMTDANQPFLIKGKKAIELRKLADKNARYDKIANPGGPPVNNQFWQLHRREIENQLDKRMASPLTPKDLGETYAGAKENLRKLTPLKIAAEDEAKKSRRLGLATDIALSAGTAVPAMMNPMYAIPAGAALAARKMLFTPGGGRMLYEGGKAVGSKLARRGGKLALAAARTGFSPDIGDNNGY